MTYTAARRPSTCFGFTSCRPSLFTVGVVGVSVYTLPRPGGRRGNDVRGPCFQQQQAPCSFSQRISRSPRTRLRFSRHKWTRRVWTRLFLWLFLFTFTSLWVSSNRKTRWKFQPNGTFLCPQTFFLLERDVRPSHKSNQRLTFPPQPLSHGYTVWNINPLVWRFSGTVCGELGVEVFSWMSL